MTEVTPDDRLAKAAAIVVTKAFSLLPTYALEGLVAGDDKAIEALQKSAEYVLDERRALGMEVKPSGIVEVSK